MRVSAVVVNWKDDERTLRCLSGLLGAKQIGHVFVIDNESAGSLRNRLDSQLEVGTDVLTLIENQENRGFAAAVNKALQVSLDLGFDAILAVNNDALIGADSIGRLIGALSADPTLALVGPRIVHPDGSPESAGGFVRPLLGITSHNRGSRSGSPDFITWACVLVRGQSLREIGLLDDAFFMYWEDVDFSLRLREHGWSIAIVNNARAVHEISTNRSSYPVAIKAYHTWSSIIFARKYGVGWRLGNVLWLALSFAANLLRLRRGALRGLRLGIRLAQEEKRPAYTSSARSTLLSRNS